MSKYAEFDQEFLARIKQGAATFSELAYLLSTKAKPFALGQPTWRVADRRLQAIRKAGKIRYVNAAWGGGGGGMSRLLIGLIGRARVGKDTAADYLCAHYGMTRYAFADPIKKMLAPVFGDLFHAGDREQPISWLGKSPRQLMQTLGTEWGRKQVHPEIWLLLAERFISASNCPVVISDVRFRNEAYWILSQGGSLIEIVRDDADSVNLHSSEMPDWGHTPRAVLNNNASIRQLHRSLDRLMTELGVAHG